MISFRHGKILAGLVCAFCLFVVWLPQPVSAATPLDDNTEFVKQVYRDFLNREPDAGGLAYWVNQIETGAFDRSELVEQYLLSAEFGETVSPVVRLYFTYYLRIPDYEGLMFWINSYKNGMSLNDISDAFATAQEFIDMYGSLTNEEFISQMYINVYGRQPDAGGLAYWTDLLDTGALTRGEVMVFFSSAEEYLTISANQVYVTMTYMGLLRRAPDQDGFDYWAGIMDQGATGLALIDGFLLSDEYADRFPIELNPERMNGYYIGRVKAPFAVFGVDLNQSTFEIFDDNITITMEHFFGETCIFTGTISKVANPLEASGTYKCSDFTNGEWSSSKIAKTSSDAFIAELSFGGNYAKYSGFINRDVPEQYQDFPDYSYDSGNYLNLNGTYVGDFKRRSICDGSDRGSNSDSDTTISITGDDILIKQDSFSSGVCIFTGKIKNINVWPIAASGTYQCSNFDEGTWLSSKIIQTGTDSFLAELDVNVPDDSCTYSVQYNGFK